METGELGLFGEPAASPVDQEAKQGQEFATIPHHPMEEQHAVDPHPRVKHALLLVVQLVGSCCLFNFYKW